MQVDWPALLEYIRAKDPALAASFRGVPRRDIAALEAEYSIRLPASYVDFLTIMGEDSGRLRPFGPTQVHTFSELLEQLPPEDYPGDRYFKVAFESDPMAVADLDTFLDLARSDGDDAPVVTFETGEDVVPTVADSDFTFGETISQRIFSAVELNKRSYAAKIFVRSQNAADGIRIKKTSIELLARSGLQLVLPEFPRVACLSRHSASVFVGVYDETKLVDIKLGTDDLPELEGLVEPLLAGLPDSDLVEPPAKRTRKSAS